MRLCRHIEFEREDVPLFDKTLGSGPVPLPARAEDRPAIVGVATDLMTETVHVLRVSASGHMVPGDRVNLVPDASGSKGRRRRIDCPQNRVERSLNRLGDLIGAPEEEHPLEV